MPSAHLILGCTLEQQFYPTSIVAMTKIPYVPAARDTDAEVVGPLNVAADVGDCTHGVLDVLVDGAVYRYINGMTWLHSLFIVSDLYHLIDSQYITRNTSELYML